MPIIHSGIKKCERCNKEFKWFCFQAERQPLSGSGLFTVESFPADEAQAFIVESNDGEIILETKCQYCHANNTIIVTK